MKYIIGTYPQNTGGHKEWMFYVKSDCGRIVKTSPAREWKVIVEGAKSEGNNLEKQGHEVEFESGLTSLEMY